MRLEFRGTQLSYDGRLMVMRELDDALGLSVLAAAALRGTRRGQNTVHRLDQPNCGRPRDRRCYSEPKTLDPPTVSGELDPQRRATWGMSDKITHFSLSSFRRDVLLNSWTAGTQRLPRSRSASAERALTTRRGCRASCVLISLQPQ